MPAKERTPDAPILDDVLLAAIERAECHQDPERDPGVGLSTVKRHLGLRHHGGTTRRLRPQLQVLEKAELITQFRRKGSDLMTLTDKGRRRLDAVRGEVTLPEAPQHQVWREAQLAASERIPDFRSDLRSALDEAIALLDADHEADSDTWFQLSERLRHTGRLLASAIYCLREWAEPDDSRIDRDDPPHNQRRRRSVRDWDSSSFPY
jgi:DNA-binding PadR family transcriptional regulator